MIASPDSRETVDCFQGVLGVSIDSFSSSADLLAPFVYPRAMPGWRFLQVSADPSKSRMSADVWRAKVETSKGGETQGTEVGGVFWPCRPWLLTSYLFIFVFPLLGFPCFSPKRFIFSCW